MIRQRLVELRFLNKPLSLVSFASSWFFYPSWISSLGTRRRSELENATYPVTAQISSVIACCKLRYLYFADVTGFRRPSPDLLNCIVLRVSTMGERDFDFPKKGRGKRGFLNHLLHSRKWVSLIICYELYKYPLQLDCMYHRGVNFLGIFTHGFADRANVPIPYLRTIFSQSRLGSSSPI